MICGPAATIRSANNWVACQILSGINGSASYERHILPPSTPFDDLTIMLSVVLV